jgi:two-component system, sensor histidine kinase and response regulator
MKSKIILVEDELDLQENIKDILEFYNFDVITADNGVLALELLAKNIIDLVISDIMMPEMDGFELLRRVRNENKLINLPFILLTAKIEKEDIRKGMEYGAEDYLTKPIHAKELVRAIEVALNKKRIRETLLNDKIHQILIEERNIKYHELRTPLFGIMSILELLTTSLNSFDYVQLKEILDTAYGASKRLNHSLLNLARFNSLENYSPNESNIISLRSFVDLKASAMEKEFIFITENDFFLEFHLEILEFIIQELLINAVKFCSKEPVEISIEKKSLVIANYQNYIKLPQILEILPFGQVNREYYEQQGLGLGLHLSKTYAEKNNAKLTAKVKEDLMFMARLDF